MEELSRISWTRKCYKVVDSRGYIKPIALALMMGFFLIGNAHAKLTAIATLRIAYLQATSINYPLDCPQKGVLLTAGVSVEAAGIFKSEQELISG